MSVSCTSLVSSGGIVPLKLFAATRNSMSEVSMPKLEGIVPDMILDPILKSVSDLRGESVSGMVPTRLFDSRLRSTRLVREPSSVGLNYGEKRVRMEERVEMKRERSGRHAGGGGEESRSAKQTHSVPENELESKTMSMSDVSWPS